MTNLYKYPKSFHLPWSPGITNDDKVVSDCNHFIGKEVVVSLKKDGENTSMYSDYIHARSLDSVHYYSRDWLKAFHAQIKNDIPDGHRICGESLYATHAIHYENLESYFYGFSMWDCENFCLSWDDTLYWFDLIGITPVEVIYRGIWDEDIIKEIGSKLDLTKEEGYVVRNADSFHYQDFSSNLNKFVRKGHVQPNDKHWATAKVIPNKLRYLCE